jgi:hypothetical protein
MKDIFDFLDVDSSFVPNTQKRHNPTNVPKNQTVNRLFNRPNLVKDTVKYFLPKSLRTQINNTVKKQNLGKPKLSKNVRAELVADYQDDILQLQELIGRDLSKWLET